MTDILGAGSCSCESTYDAALLSSLRDIFARTHLQTLTRRVYLMEEMAAIDETFERKHEPLPTNLVLLVIILVLFHVGAIVSNF